MSGFDWTIVVFIGAAVVGVVIALIAAAHEKSVANDKDKPL